MRVSALTLFIFTVLSIPLAAMGQEKTPEKIDPNYPGLRFDGSAIGYAGFEVGMGARAFYKVFQRWPKNWKEVNDSGIFTAKLPGPELQAIDPDDGSLDCWGDVTYEGGSPPKVHELVNNSGKVITNSLNPPVTYEAMFAAFQKHDPNFDANYFLSHVDRLKLLAIAGMLKISVDNFHFAKGRYPKDMFELIDDGYGPVTRQTNNPVNGYPFTFDGRLFDFRYLNEPDAQGLNLITQERSGAFFSY